jgi:hypothetical protein
MFGGELEIYITALTRIAGRTDEVNGVNLITGYCVIRRKKQQTNENRWARRVSGVEWPGTAAI